MPRKRAQRIERRRSARADASLSMRVEGRPADGGLTQVVTESRNISASGVYCTTSHYLAPLSKVALTIVLPHRAGQDGVRRLLKCDGVVVRCVPADRSPRHHGYELACSFIGLDSRHRGLLDEFVTWRNLQAMRGPGASGDGARRVTRRKSAARATRRKTAARAVSNSRSRRAATR